MDLQTIFVRPPGDLLYFVFVIVVSLTSLLMTSGQQTRRASDKRLQRYNVALFGVMIAWGVLVAGAVMALIFEMDFRLIFPPLERAVLTLIVALLCWVYLTADHSRWGRLPDVLIVLVAVGVLAGYLATAIEWSAQLQTPTDFNQTRLSAIWALVPLVIAAVGVLMVVTHFGAIIDAPLKLVFLALLVVGYGATLFQATQGDATGDYPAFVRLAFIAAMGIAIVIVYRVVITRVDTLISSDTIMFNSPSAPGSQGVRSVSASPSAVVERAPEPTATTRSPIERESAQLLRALGMMLENATPAALPAKIVTATLELLRADVGALLQLQDANYADIMLIYDRMMKTNRSGYSLNLGSQPTLINAVQRRTQRPLLVDRNREELEDLYSRLDIGEIGPAYFQPLIHDNELIAILLIALPYTKRELYSQEEEILKGIALMAGGLLALSIMATDASLTAEERAIQAIVQGVAAGPEGESLAARIDLQQNLQIAREQIAELTRQVMAMKQELDRERSRIANALGDDDESLSVSQKITAISLEQQALRDERDQLLVRLQAAEAALAGASDSDDQAVLEQMVEALQRERDELLSQRERLQAELDDLRLNEGDGLIMPEALQPVIERMSTEKARLEVERDEYQRKLATLEAQLRTYGIDDSPSGLAQLIGKLYEERALLQARNDALMAELERAQKQPASPPELEARLQALQTQLKHLAADREAVTRQRDMFRKQRDEINAKLESVKQHRARMVAQVSNLEMELKEAHDEQSKLWLDVQKLSDERGEVFHQLAQVMAEKEALTIERDQLLARLGEDVPVQSIEPDKDGVSSLRAMVTALSGQRNVLEQEIIQLKATVANLENQLEAAKLRAKSPPQQAESVAYSPQSADLIVGLVQELRTPMTSIVGYVDLLLGESPGILGDMQRKFLQRVLTNVTRLTSMIEDLIRVTELDTGKFSLAPAPLDIVALIEDAITNAAMQFREKGLMLTLNIEENLPEPIADRDAVTQVIGQLLTNAYLVSPPESEVTISVGQRRVILARDVPQPRPVDCIYVSVEDRGGGVPPEDEARVFARKYRADNPLIEGLGDTGVGLAIAKVLVEAHQGRLWLETQENVGTRFNFVLPLNMTGEAGA